MEGTSEPTLRELATSVRGVDLKITDLIGAMEERFMGIDSKIEKLATRVETGYISLNTRMDTMGERLTGVEHHLSKVEVTMLDMQEELRASLAATDQNSIRLLDHEKRIRKLEKARR